MDNKSNIIIVLLVITTIFSGFTALSALRHAGLKGVASEASTDCREEYDNVVRVTSDPNHSTEQLDAALDALIECRYGKIMSPDGVY